MSRYDRLNEYIKSLFGQKKVSSSEITKKYNEIVTMKDPMFDYGNKYATGGSAMWTSTTTTSPTPSIKNIQNPSEEQIILALRYNGLELKYVKNQTEKYCMIAIAENPLAIGFVNNQMEELCFMALKLDYHTLGHIRYPTKNIINKAIEINPECYRYINQEKFPNEYKYAKLQCV